MDSIILFFESVLTWIVNTIDGPLWDVTIILLLGAGLFFTLTTGFVQLRLLPQSLREMWGGRSTEGKSLTPFQAFTTGLASRVGVGNIGGVATAIALGGPGAVFWMWITALMGMSSAFAESSLAQLYKTKDPNGMFRGGPAYYITRGLKLPSLAIAFAVTLIFTFGFAFNAVQSNSIVEATKNAWDWNPVYVGMTLVVITGLIISGGVKRIGKVSAQVVPMMALFYLIIAVIILGMNIEKVPSIISLIIESAFDFSAAAGGTFGALVSKTMLMGIKRGLFSNEAGMGSAPNSAATSDAKHPASQGLIQMLGVFVDTIVVCTCTAVIILMSNNYGGETLRGISLTQSALQFHLGEFGLHFLAFVILLFCFTSIIGNYAYAETNIRYIKNSPWFVWGFRAIVLFFVYFGAVRDGGIVWAFADTVMASMAVINLVAILILAPIVWIILKDYLRQVKSGKEPVFRIEEHQDLIHKGVDPLIWKSKE
ncbi:TPA: alanine:cation symporter family protein [Mannheimia haemolytica]|uniref:Alanine:cation symporter family protein n=1 Tax=Mannheimia haemolytica TaxID=75985 RepID=A0A249A0K4_MANHA|nr:sodium:alanine symporter family protein [Mannheimia haemolytica]AWW71439.1 alanine:cation symporter family protein [Pasteurellaceae bacterium 12565]AGI32608.2 alanine:cation symporter family protein [Mannheimia haemolytica USDA-ARS-USMARC-183]AGI35491.1 alanine:cation symporter family protein [Mannheimia haemolytica USDA-ARS-USMARC-185]AGK02273.1 amino acid carrier protein AgcS [Mannheimia haemolytica M42548]AGQ24881.1 transporter [Mannheimia haemolytica D153]